MVVGYTLLEFVIHQGLKTCGKSILKENVLMCLTPYSPKQHRVYLGYSLPGHALHTARPGPMATLP